MQFSWLMTCYHWKVEAAQMNSKKSLRQLSEAMVTGWQESVLKRMQKLTESVNLTLLRGAVL